MPVPLSLPPPAVLLRLCQSLAVLDAILQPEWDLRYYSFDAHWNPSKGLQMASMRTGEGDHWFCLFYPGGATALKGYVQGMPTRPELWEDLPEEFHADFREEPAFDREATIFCLWRRAQEDAWQYRSALPGDDPDGSADLLALLDGKPATYREWAEEYFEIEAPLPAIEHVYSHRPLTYAVIAALNPERKNVEDLEADLADLLLRNVSPHG